MSAASPVATGIESRSSWVEVLASVLLTAVTMMILPIDRWFGAQLYGVQHQAYLATFFVLLIASLKLVPGRFVRGSVGGPLVWGALAGYTSSVLAYAAVPFLLVLFRQRLIAFFFDSPRAFAATFAFPLVALQWTFGVAAAWLLWCLTSKAATGRRRVLVLGTLLLLGALRVMSDMLRP